MRRGSNLGPGGDAVGAAGAQDATAVLGFLVRDDDDCLGALRHQKCQLIASDLSQLVEIPGRALKCKLVRCSVLSV